MNSKKNIYIIIAALTLLGAVLRFWDMWQTPLMNDELSAIFRTHYDSFSDLFEKGIKPDGHPPMVQVFIYLWIKIGGESSVWLKLPFLLMGVASIPLIYIVGRKWASESAAVLSAVYMATLQYTVFYSQLSRPYIFGLFLILCFLLYWTQIVLERKWQMRTIILYLLVGVAIANTHYFALLTLIVLGLLGLFVVEKNLRIKYIVLNLGWVVLFLPSLPIVLDQLGRRGVGTWLGKPTSDFIWNYFDYITNFSWWVKSAVLVLFLFGLKNNVYNKKTWLGLLVFAVVFLTGFLYSYYINPVLQYSVMIFAFPFLLFFLLGNIPELPRKYLILLVFCVVTVNVYSLVKERNYYTYFYKSPHQEILKEADAYIQKQNKQPLTLLYTNAKFNQYFFEQYQYHFTYVDLNQYSGAMIKFLQDTLSKYSGDKLIYGALSSEDPVWLNVMLEYFPYIETHKNYFIGTYYILSKTKPTNEVHEIILDSTLVNKPFYTDSTSEWTPAFDITLNQVLQNPNYEIDIIYDLEVDTALSNIAIVSQLMQDTSVKQWREQDLAAFQNGRKSFTTYHSLRMADTKNYGKHLQLKFFLWNKSKQYIQIKNIRLRVRKGNPVLYGFYEPF